MFEQGSLGADLRHRSVRDRASDRITRDELYLEAATVEGDVENDVQLIGQAQGLVDDLPHAGDLVRSVVGEAEDLIAVARTCQSYRLIGGSSCRA